VLQSPVDASQAVLHVDYSESKEGTFEAPADKVHETITTEEVDIEVVEAVSVRKDNLRFVSLTSQALLC
jgi:hypothetical protein